MGCSAQLLLHASVWRARGVQVRFSNVPMQCTVERVPEESQPAPSSLPVREDGIRLLYNVCGLQAFSFLILNQEE